MRLCARTIIFSFLLWGALNLCLHAQAKEILTYSPEDLDIIESQQSMEPDWGDGLKKLWKKVTSWFSDDDEQVDGHVKNIGQLEKYFKCYMDRDHWKLYESKLKASIDKGAIAAEHNMVAYACMLFRESDGFAAKTNYLNMIGYGQIKKETFDGEVERSKNRELDDDYISKKIEFHVEDMLRQANEEDAKKDCESFRGSFQHQKFLGYLAQLKKSVAQKKLILEWDDLAKEKIQLNGRPEIEEIDDLTDEVEHEEITYPGKQDGKGWRSYEAQSFSIKDLNTSVSPQWTEEIKAAIYLKIARNISHIYHKLSEDEACAKHIKSWKENFSNMLNITYSRRDSCAMNGDIKEANPKLSLGNINIKENDQHNIFFGAAYLGVLRDKILRGFPGFEKLSITNQYVVTIMSYNAGFGVLDNRQVDFSKDPEAGFIDFLEKSDGMSEKKWDNDVPFAKREKEDGSFHESFRHAASIYRCMQPDNFDGQWGTPNKSCEEPKIIARHKADSLKSVTLSRAIAMNERKVFPKLTTKTAKSNKAKKSGVIKDKSKKGKK